MNAATLDWLDEGHPWRAADLDASRAVVSAGESLTRKPAAWEALRRHIEQLRARESLVLLVHPGQTAAEEVGRRAGAETLALPDHELDRDADFVAERIAREVGADLLDFATDVPGVYTETGRAEALGARRVRELIRQGTVRGGMVPKLQSALTGVFEGVDAVRIGSPRSLLRDRATRILPRRRRAGGDRRRIPRARGPQPFRHALGAEPVAA